MFIVDMDWSVESSIITLHLNVDIIVPKVEDYYLRFPIKNIDNIPDYNENINYLFLLRRQNIPNEFNSFVNRNFVFKVMISMFNLQNDYLAYTIRKMTNDEGVVGAVVKRSPAYEHYNIHSDDTPIHK
uniref:Uncharacterized protein n=1 Tax=Lactuca sativa TaxID=4236 RepID=A0A9R1WBL4_LACSA|nr:hypothetical protein LSAT_V11C200065080 [Lactuca sativa]